LTGDSTTVLKIGFATKETAPVEADFSNFTIEIAPLNDAVVVQAQQNIEPDAKTSSIDLELNMNYSGAVVDAELFSTTITDFKTKVELSSHRKLRQTGQYLNTVINVQDMFTWGKWSVFLYKDNAGIDQIDWEWDGGKTEAAGTTIENIKPQ
jgi:hypothetical protein